MKQLIIYMSLMVPTSLCFCQQQDSSRAIKDIKTNKKIAWISLAVAAASFTTAAIMDNGKGENKGKALNYVGFVSALASVTFFNAAYRERKEFFPLSKSEHIQRSKSQKTAAWLLLGTGTVVFGIAEASLPKGDDSTLTVAGKIGFGVMLASVPFFFGAKEHKKDAKALTVSLKSGQVPFLKGCMISKNSYPAVSIQIHV